MKLEAQKQKQGQAPQRTGQAALVAVILMLFIMLSAIFGASSVALKEARVAEENKKSKLSFFAAESGLEDAVYRLKRGKSVASSFSVSLNGATATTTVTTIGAIKNIKSSGDFLGANRSMRSTLVNGIGISFHYGVQVGDDGLEMGNGSSINGNVFSNGNISGGGSGQSRISGNAQAAGNSSITNIRVNNGASAHSFSNCIIDGQAQYVSLFSNCTASSTQVIAQNVVPQDFPITPEQITEWKNDAAAGGTMSGFSIGNNSSATTGPKKVNGNITFGNGSKLTLTGTVWVTGTIQLGNTDIIALDPGTFGSLSGLIIVDGKVNIGNNVTMRGSGQSGSYLMLLVTAAGEDAIEVGNNATGTIFYAPNGEIEIGNNLKIYEVAAKGLEIGNNSSVTYESGLANVNFTSGPTGGWDITDWGEVVQ